MGMRSCMKDTMIWKFVNTRPGKLTKFVILLILDLIDVAVDWYFYAKVKLIEPGLVYGPPEEPYKWAIFSFCIVSTLVSLIETIQNADDLAKKKKLPFLTQSFTNFLTIIFEDVPLLILNLMVALCRDGDVSVISLTKASLCIACVIIRFILMILVYWMFDKKKSRFEFFCDIISTIGLVVVTILSVTIQLLNNFPIDNNDLIKITSPENFNRYSFFSNKYFTNVGIYMSWPLQDSSSKEFQINESKIWLADLNELTTNEELEVEFQTNIDLFLKYENSYPNYTLCILKSKTKREPKVKNCFTITNNNKYVYEKEFQLGEQQLDYGYKLKFIKRAPKDFKYLMGYIDYNIKIRTNNECHNFDNTSINSDYLLIYAKYLFKKPISISNNTISNEYFKYNEGVNYYSLFNLYFDLNIANQIWKTGIIGCKQNSDKSPKLNKNIEILC